LCSVISYLTGFSAWIMGMPDYFQELFVRDHFRIKSNASHLCMTGLAGNYLPVGWIFNLTAGKSNSNIFDAFNLIIYRFYTPKTPLSKRCQLHLGIACI